MKERINSNLVVLRRAAQCAMVVLSLAVYPRAFAGDLYSEAIDAAIAGDYKTAAKKWTELAIESDGRSQFQLALLYHAGLFVQRSETMAVQLYTSAAEKGVPEAQEYLAAGYANGWFGLPQNDALAQYWQNKFEGSTEEQIAQR